MYVKTINKAGTHIYESHIYESHLYESHFYESHLYESHLYESHLYESHLYESHLYESHLYESHLYESHLSISPHIKSKIIDDGKKHTSKDHKGATRHYRAICNKGILYRFGLKIQVLIEGKKTQNSNRISIINRCSVSYGAAQTEIGIDKDSRLEIRYDFAEGKILTCKRVSPSNQSAG